MTVDRGWPFVGRESHVARIVDVWRAGGQGVLLEGLPGMGTTRLADEAVRAIGVDGHVRIVANPASRTRPYAAIAHLLGGHVDGVVLRRVTDALPAQRIPMVVDEPALLDDASLAVINQLLSARRVMVIAAAHRDASAPPALLAILRGHGLVTINVGPLSRDDVAESARRYLGGDLDPGALDRLIDLSGGHPLFVRELLTTATEQQSVHRLPSGVLVDFDAAANLHLREIVAERLAELDPDSVSLIRLLAVAETLGIDDLDAMGQLDRCSALEDAGWLRVDLADGGAPGGTVRIAHALHAEVLRARMGQLETRRQMRRAIDALQRRTELTTDDQLRLAVWQLEAGDQPDIDVIIRGARRARAAMDLPSTYRLAQAADLVRPDVTTQTLLMEVLFLRGEFVRAIEVARRPLPRELSWPALFTSTALWVDIVIWGFGDDVEAIRIGESRRPLFREHGIEPLLDGLIAYVQALAGRTTDALRSLPETDDPMMRLLTTPGRQMALDRAGRLTESLAASNAALEILGGFPQPKAVMDPSFFQVSRCLVLLGLGRFADARHDAEAAHHAAVVDGVPFLRAFLPIVLGRVALAEGRTNDARGWFEEGRVVADAAGMRTAERIAVAGLAEVDGLGDDRRAASAALGALDALDDPLPLMLVESAGGRAWALQAVGQRDQARALLRDVIAARAAEEPGPTLGALCQLARLGDASWAAARLPLVEQVDGPYATAQRSFIEAVASGAPARLDEALQRLVALSAWPLAAEAATLLASHHARVGDVRASGAAQTVANDALSRCQDISTPLLAVTGALPLSPRERDVALLAAEGVTSREIAARLHLSVRTVDNHLSRAYMKLGVSSRQQLSSVLARHPDGA